MPRSIWKGAISFGLVHIPVSLHPATRDDRIDFDWLDRRSMDPVGYKRINKRTGKAIDKEEIVRGVKIEDGRYVVLEDDEIRAAYPKTMQTIEIEAFVEASEIAFVHLERPYYLAPLGKSEKVYVLLRETLAQTGRIGIARIVLNTRQHLAGLIASGPALILNTLRWSSEILPVDELPVPAEGTGAVKLSEGEKRMAAQLVTDMSMPWDPAHYSDTFRDAIMKLVDQRAEAGETASVTPIETEPSAASLGSNVVDLTELLRRSLGKGGAKPERDAAPERAPARSRKPARAGVGKKRA